MTYALPAAAYRRREATSEIVVHCAATDAEEVTAADVRRWHVQERGWIDGGYHCFIRRDGSLELLRPVWAVGAGVEGHNATTVHVCMAGGGRAREADNFTPAQWRTLASVVVLLRELLPGPQTVRGHREYPGVSKWCPSFDVGAWLAREGLARTA
ncbi:MAG: N-acetylmuramoyl-L-alanine amidase [Gemmatimonadaceae bacterium]